MAPRASKAKKNTTNGVSPAKLKEVMADLHGLTDQMEAASARSRGKINKVYDAASEALAITKVALKRQFRKERRERKDLEWARGKADAADRESFLRLANTYGTDTPMGNYALRLAEAIPNVSPEDADADAGDGQESSDDADTSSPD